MIDVIRTHIYGFMQSRNMPQQVKSVLSKIMTCRTSILDGHVYQCPSCQDQINVYNSCGDRHCPLCSGAKRGDWLDRAKSLVRPMINYFQVVFTLPDLLYPLALGNRKKLYDLLFHSAWEALSQRLRETGKFQPAALMVLHTWNQRMEHHPHLHVIVPGGGPSLDGSQWIKSRHPTEPRRKKPCLDDNTKLGRAFRECYLAGLKRLFVDQKLKLEGPWSELMEPEKLAEWLADLEFKDWNVFIQAPPNETSKPEDALKYLTRYMTGGPISDSRLLSVENGAVTFVARSKNKRAGNPPVEVSLSANEFLRRWCLHILPKGFTKARYYGGYHGSKRDEYLKLCEQLLPTQPTPSLAPDAPQTTSSSITSEPVAATTPKCPKCQIATICIGSKPRPSWRDVFDSRSYSTHKMVLPIHGRTYIPDD